MTRVDLSPEGFVRELVKSLRVDGQLAVFGTLANTIAGSVLVPRALRIPLLRLAGIDVRRAHIWPGVFFGHRRVKIGDRVTVNRMCFFDSFGGVEIGDRVHVGHQVSFICSSHEIGDSSHRCGRSFSQPIKVGRGCWVGARSTILCGVTIGEGCVIGAGALVIADCEPNGVYAGVPAKRIKELA